MECTHCGSLKYVKNGSYKGVQRYRCKKYFHSFSDKVRRFSFADKKKFMQLILNNTGIRKSALILDCSHCLLIFLITIPWLFAFLIIQMVWI